MVVTDLARTGPSSSDPLCSAWFRIHGQDLLAANGGPQYPSTEVDLLGYPDPGRASRARDAMLRMSRIEIAVLEAAADGT